MLHLGVDHKLVALRSLSVKAGNGLAAELSPGLSIICLSGGRGTAGTAADNHLVILHARVNGITLVLRDHCFDTMNIIAFVTRV